jgi:predicted outer membrane repeat protein
MEANALAGADTIILPAGTYILSIVGTPPEEESSVSGDLDITSDLTIKGAGSSVTIINGNATDRVFESRPVTGATVNVTISGVTITNGYVTGIGFVGAAFGDRGFTTGITNLTLTEVVINANTCGNNGGGIGLVRKTDAIGNPSLTLTRSVISNNSATNGGGIYCSGCTTNINESLITGNTVSTVGGGIGIAGNTTNVTVAHSTISGNTANSHGGGVGKQFGTGTALINFSTVANNTADNDNNGGDGGGIYANSGITIQNSIVQGNTDRSTASFNDCNSSTNVSSAGFNVVGSGTGCPSGGTGDTTTSANLGALADNGGPTNSHMPGASSAAIDRIPNGTNGCTAGSTTDQRSVVRGVDVTSCDSGAIELDSTPAYRRCAVSAGQTYDMESDVYVQINTLGTLGCVTVTHYNTNHPNATLPLQTGKYWNIDGGGGSGFNVSLTLPDTQTVPVICEYLIASSQWDCSRTHQVDNGGSVTRSEITSFSDWAVGENPGPTAIELHRFSVSQGKTLAGFGLLGIVGVVALLTLARQRRKPIA